MHARRWSGPQERNRMNRYVAITHVRHLASRKRWRLSYSWLLYTWWSYLRRSAGGLVAVGRVSRHRTRTEACHMMKIRFQPGSQLGGYYWKKRRVRVWYSHTTLQQCKLRVPFNYVYLKEQYILFHYSYTVTVTHATVP